MSILTKLFIINSKNWHNESNKLNERLGDFFLCGLFFFRLRV